MPLPLTVLRPAASDLPLDRGEVLRLLGYRPGVTRLDARHEALVDRGIAVTLEVAAPVVSMAFCAVTADGDRVATVVPGLTWQSRSLSRLLRDAAGVTLVAATVGTGVDELIDRLFHEEEYALATIVDAAGSALVHGLSSFVSGTLADGAAAGVLFSSLYGPGYGDWPVTDLPALVAALGPHVTATPTGYLLPQKSLAGLIGWLPGEAGGRRRPTGCALCTMSDCAYRVRPAEA